MNHPRINLTPRQAEVFAMLAQGLRHKEIARELSIEPKTVRNHIEQALERNDAPNALALCVQAVVQGVITV